jgi:integrase
MCGRFTATAAFDVLAERFGITIDEGTTEELTARYNVSPSQAVPIIVNRSRARPPLVASGRRLVMAKWGFRPVAIARTYGWRVKSEVFPLQRRHLDLKAGILRLDPGTTKNSDGRVVYLTMELKRLLSAQAERVERLSKKLGRIVPWLFPHVSGPRRAGTQRKGMRKRWGTAVVGAGARPHSA